MQQLAGPVAAVLQVGQRVGVAFGCAGRGTGQPLAVHHRGAQLVGQSPLQACGALVEKQNRDRQHAEQSKQDQAHLNLLGDGRGPSPGRSHRCIRSMRREPQVPSVCARQSSGAVDPLRRRRRRNRRPVARVLARVPANPV
jgi:hypothetical protein